ncbi:helix-turn-helix transcriptional regulator [Nonomuraea longicatena]|uniref:Helix-turn-helix transcriptional regulator n=1 Tax=Nonomuraea longicatena TaxID=83682 RepID=A0ABP4A103_9ACTN
MPPARDLDSGASPLAYFGAELRHLRVKAGLSQEQVGEAVFCSGSLIGLIENAKRSPSPDLANRCDELLKTGGMFNRMLPLLRSASHPSWFQSWVEVERTAHSLRTWEPIVVPGLLQTKDYAYALFARYPGVTPEKAEASAMARVERQAILHQDEPPLLWAVIDEGVLHRPIARPEVMRAQLATLLTMAQAPNITLQVVPLSAGTSCGLAAGFVIAGVRGGADTVYLDSAAAGYVTGRPDDVVGITHMYEQIRADALSGKESVSLLEKVMDDRWAQT